MSWLRIDDGFTTNAKIVQLSDSQFRVWMRLLCYCTSARDPSVDSFVLREISGLDKRRLRTFHRLGLLDKIGDDFEVHDWAKYLPKDAQNATRQAKFRARHRNAESNAERNASSNEEVTPEPSRTGAGTRGVPSRPVPKDQNPTPPQPSTDSLPPELRPQPKNGSGGGTEKGLEPIAQTAAELIAQLRGAA